MAEKDILMLRQKDLRRLHVVHKVLEETMTQREAAQLISLSERQIRRIVERIRREGDKGVCHTARGKPSNRRFPKKLKDRIVRLYKTTYADFGPTLFTEKLAERDSISISRETARSLAYGRGALDDTPEAESSSSVAGEKRPFRRDAADGRLPS